jgi:mono/diheme cytochrome c family protein
MAVLLFVLFWVLIALLIFFVASRGGPRGARATLQAQSHGGRRVAAVVFAVVYVGMGIGVPTALLIGSHHNANAEINGDKLSVDAKHGRKIFGDVCGACHTLAEAGAVGKVGPNLDDLKPTKALLQDALVHGRQRGNGTMPANLLPDPNDQRDVIDFVYEVTHPPVAGAKPAATPAKK